MKIRAFSVLALLMITALTTACDGRQGTDIIGGVPIGIPLGSGPNPSGNSATPEIGVSCALSDPNHICLGLKYVVYADEAGKAVVARDAIMNDVTATNVVWGQCNLGFQIDYLVIADPRSYGLRLNPSDTSELDSIRSAFAANNLLLVVTTGTWGRSGTLGSTSANAWANMPGSYVMGVVLEEPVGGYPNIIAHELGHYLSLGHASDTSNVMNPVIYSNSTRLDASQCGSARAAAKYWWANMFRS